MSHMLERRNGQISFAYLEGVKRWHGLGNEILPGADINEWQKKSGFTYEVALGKLEAVYADGRREDYSDKRFVYRVDDGKRFAVVGKDWKPVQPREILEFMDHICKLAGYQMTTAGVVFGGARIWALVKTGDTITVMDDKVEPFVLLATAFDGTLATTAKKTSITVVCNNTLSGSLNEGNGLIKIRHQQKFDADALRNQLGIKADSWKAFIATARLMAKTKVKPQTAASFVEKLLADVYKAKDPVKSPTYAQILARFDGDLIGAEQKARNGTVWGLVNSVTEHADHSAAKSEDARFIGAQFGLGAKLKDTAFAMARELVKA